MTAFTILRYVVFGAVALTALLAFGAMAVQRRIINPFGRPARTLRDLSDPFLKPIERRILRAGGNPQSAPWWLIGVALIAGILVISTVQWGAAQIAFVSHAAQAGGRTLAYVIVSMVLNLLVLAILVRVIGSWFGMGPYHKFMRPFYAMTEWFIAPLRRVLPPFGPLDLSPLVAYLLIQFVVRPLLLRLF